MKKGFITSGQDLVKRTHMKVCSKHILAGIKTFDLNEYLAIFKTKILQGNWYFYSYKTFTFKNNPKNLDLSYKMNQDLWYCLGRVKIKHI